MIAWPAKYIGTKCPALESLSPEDQATLEEWAGDLLASWVKGTYGLTQWSVTQLCSPQWGCSGGCTHNRIALRAPVQSIDSVKSEGVEVDSSTWDLCGHIFTFVGGTPPDWEIVYTAGRVPPVGGQLAAGALACERAKDVAGDKCALPGNTTMVTRTGVTVQLKPDSPTETGIWEVDSWVASVQIPAGVIIPTQRCVQSVKVSA